MTTIQTYRNDLNRAIASTMLMEDIGRVVKKPDITPTIDTIAFEDVEPTEVMTNDGKTKKPYFRNKERW